MATDTPDTAPTRQTFTFYAAQGRAWASNVDQKLIDLGELVQDQGAWRWKLDGNSLAGTAPSARAALEGMAERMGFLYLDGQFTALVDMRGSDGVHLDGATQVDIAMDEIQPGERMQDASV